MRLASIMFAAAIAVSAGAAAARDAISIVGSASAYARATDLSERFVRANPAYSAQVTTGGSSGGLRRFCEGLGPDGVDIAMSVRQIRDAEIGRCARAGVPLSDIIELLAGYEAFVFAYGDDGPRVDFARVDLYRAFAAEIFVDGAAQPNPNRSWRQIRADFPDVEISLITPWDRVFSPLLLERMIGEGCRRAGDYDAYVASGMSAREAAAACETLRTDGVIFALSGDWSDVEAEIGRDSRAIGLLTFEHYDRFSGGVRAATIEGRTATRSAIASEAYPFSRPLFFYVKKPHFLLIPGLEDFVAFIRAEVAAGR